MHHVNHAGLSGPRQHGWAIDVCRYSLQLTTLESSSIDPRAHLCALRQEHIYQLIDFHLN